MGNNESRFPLLRCLIVLIVFEEMIEFVEHRLIRSIVDITFLIDQP